MRTSRPIFLGAVLLLTTLAAHAQVSSGSDGAPPGTVPISSLVATVAQKTHRVRSIPAGWLVPILRPMVPQQGHFAAMPCSNDLVMSDRFANVRRIEAIIKAMDTGAPIKTPSCIVPMPHPWMSGSPPTRQPH
jgi:general secretion pathway protein D